MRDEYVNRLLIFLMSLCLLLAAYKVGQLRDVVVLLHEETKLQNDILTDLVVKVEDSTKLIQSRAAVPYTEEELLMLATLIDNEARNQPLEGKIAVGAVVINRVEHPKFGDSVQEVILSPGQFCKLRYVGEELHPDSMAAAMAALRGDDPTHGALYFYNHSTTTSQWSRGREPTVKIKDHVFTL